jgi:hypothetical protein
VLEKVTIPKIVKKFPDSKTPLLYSQQVVAAIGYCPETQKWVLILAVYFIIM